jgi:tetratricopeptide (TPR) repeat protein
MAVKQSRLAEPGGRIRRMLLAWMAALSIVASGVQPGRASSAQETTPAVGSAAPPCQQDIAVNRRALQSLPGDPALELRLARSLALCQQDGEAIARYLGTIASQPGEVAPRIELGSLLVREQRSGEAIDLLREALRLDSENDQARLGLARALAAAGNNLEALLRYDEVLAASPAHYDALQGKAFVLYHSARFAEARTIFEFLQRENPSDAENVAALARIARAETEASAAALEPPPGAAPEERLAYYRNRVAKDASDRAALFEVGRAQVELKDFAAAIRTYRQALAIDPSDGSAKFQLARTLAWSQQYDASIALYQEILRSAPRDADFLGGLARVYTWSGRLEDALRAYQRLADTHPSEAVLLEIARLDFRLNYVRSAGAAVARLLSEDPENRDARRLRAQIELKQGRTEKARQQFAAILQKAPHDPEALLGEAEAWYYLGRLDKAYEVAGTLRQDQPQNVDTLLLLARIDRARGDRKAAMARVEQCEQVSPSNPEVRALETTLRDETASTLHTSAAYAREIGSGESLTTLAYGTDFEFKMLRRTDSTFSLDDLPSLSPSGAIQGAAAPSQFLYRQTTRLSQRFTVRTGLGLVRFGPGGNVNVPGQPEAIIGAGVRPIGLAGASIVLTPIISADFNWTRSAIVYTPASVRLGVIDRRYDAGLSFRWSRHTELRLEYFRGVDRSEEYLHIKFVNPQTVTSIRADRLPYSGGAITFSQSLVRSRRFSVDAGYSGLETQFVNLGGQTYLGFFDPALYQRHLATARFFGKLCGPLAYDLSGGFGAQQTEQDGRFQRAFNLSPVFTLRTSPRLTLGLGYTYYNFAQTLGEMRGNSLRLTSDWKF